MESGDAPQPSIELQNGTNVCPVHGSAASKGGHSEADKKGPRAVKPLPPLPREVEAWEDVEAGNGKSRRKR
jgi:hypothetical protein